ncbi:MAG: hypothetical protein ACPGNV_00840 [Mangrovicoccus sp.]
MRKAWFIAALAALAACEAPDLGAPTAADHQAAEAFAATAIESRFPSYGHAAPVASCIAQGATDQELLQLAGQAGRIRESAKITLAVAIAQRPATQTCIVNKNVPPLG